MLKFTVLKRFWFILFSLLSVSLSAQLRVTGTVLDAEQRTPMDFAEVVLQQGEQTIAGTVTDENGAFELQNLKKGNYTLLISFLGYQSVEKQVALTKTLNVGKIYLQPDDKVLQEVEVVGQQSTMRFELDKKVFTVDQNIAAAGGSVTDALENIPSVDVDQEGNISLRQNDAVEIWINGKPAGLTSDNRADVLRQLPADQIQEIEVITNPSAKYSPEGTAGIINLVMKKDRKAGYFGSVNAGIQYPWGGIPGGNAGLNININKGIVDAYFNVGYHYHSSHGSQQTDRKTIDPLTQDTLTRLQQDASNNRGGGGVFLRGGIDLRITDRSTLGFSAFGIVGDRSRSKSENEYRNTDYQMDTVIRHYTRNETGRGSHPGGNGMITYQFKPNKKHNLNLSASYNQFSWNEDKTYTEEELDKTANSIQQEQINKNTDRMVQLKADYEWKPTEQSRLEAGWQTDLAWRNTDASAYDLNGDDKQELLPYYNDFLNREQIHALYITYGNRFWKRLSVQVGLRAEYMQRHIFTDYYDASSALTHVEQDTSYFQLFPSAYISYSFDNGHELQLNYTRRVDRPRGHQINPRMDFSDSTNIQYGNPSLLPAYSSALELNYLKQWEKHTLSAGIFYRFTDGVIQNVKYMDGDVMKNTFINISKRQDIGLELIGKNRLFGNLLQLTTSVNVNYNNITAEDYHGTMNGTPVDVSLKKQETFVLGVRLNANFLFTKTFSGQISGRYSSPRVVAQGRTDHSYTIDLGLRKTFLDKKLALSLNVRDLLDSRSRSNTTWGDRFWQWQMRRWNSRSIGLTITYNFGNMQQKPKMPQQNISTSSYDSSEGED